ncbi:hypothetical protein ACIQUF_19095 [Pseudomonas sp. NPDC090233]|uniref:hypothetical protein n=1 Tax=Pseudomonas sp. NPDC090233 TaxID=3364479 RepID=UPI00383BCD15
MIKNAIEFKELCDIDSDTTFAYQQASEEIWLEILKTYPEITMAVASNKTIPDSIIELLSTSSDIEIRWTIATKRKLNRMTFDRLSVDNDALVRHSIACNPKVPRDILFQLTQDPDEKVAYSANRKLEKLQHANKETKQPHIEKTYMNTKKINMITNAIEFKEICEGGSNTNFAHQQAPEEIWLEILNRYPELDTAVASNKTIPDSIIELLSISDDVNVRWRIALKRRLSRSAFDRLAIDKDASVRQRIACNPKVPIDILRQLTQDDDEMVADSAKKKLAKLPSSEA